MKFIAKYDIRNVASMRLKDEDGKSTVAGAKHDDHIHKGAAFDIGPEAKTLQELSKKDREAGVLAALLISTGAAVDASDAKAVQAVKDEIAVDEKRAEAAKKLDVQSQLAGLGSAALSALTAKAK